MVMSEGPDLDDEVGRPPGHLAKEDGSVGTDSKTYQTGVCAVMHYYKYRLAPAG